MYLVYNYRIEFDTITFKSTERVWDVPKPDDLPIGQLSVGILADDSLHGYGAQPAGCFVKPPMFIVLHPVGDLSTSHPLVNFVNGKVLSASQAPTDKTKPIFVNFYRHGFSMTSLGSDDSEVELIYVPERGIDDAFASHMCGPIDFSAVSGDASIRFAFTVVIDSTNQFTNELNGGGYYVITDRASHYPNSLAGYAVSKPHATDSVNTICSVTTSGGLKPISGTLFVKEGDTPLLTIGSNFAFNGVSANSETDIAVVKRLIQDATSHFVVR